MQMYFDEGMFDLIWEKSELYSRQKIDQTLLWVLSMNRFLGISLFSGYHSFSREDLYWLASVDALLECKLWL